MDKVIVGILHLQCCPKHCRRKICHKRAKASGEQKEFTDIYTMSNRALTSWTEVVYVQILP